MNTEDMDQKTTTPDVSYAPSLGQGRVATTWHERIAELKYTFTTRDGWIGDYVGIEQLERWYLRSDNCRTTFISLRPTSGP